MKRFVDRVIVSVKSGMGGDGCVSFDRSANKRVGPPDGGNGGKGGSVFVACSEKSQDLNGIRKVYRAANGEHGKGKQMTGADAKDLVIELPRGTAVTQLQRRSICRPFNTVIQGGKLFADPDADDESEIHNSNKYISKQKRREMKKMAGYIGSKEEQLTEEEVQEEEQEEILHVVEGAEEGEEFLHGDDTWMNEEYFERRLMVDFFNEERKSLFQPNNISSSFSYYGRPTNDANIISNGVYKTSKKSKKEVKDSNNNNNNNNNNNSNNFLYKPILIAKGGRGGKGNMMFATALNRSPDTGTVGSPGEEVLLEFEMRLIADVGLVGMPNVGKSTLLSAVTRAQLVAADYAFTTLAPRIGVARHTLGSSNTAIGPSIRIADLPGIIKDAHLDRGMGLEFIKHIERTAVFAFVIDVSVPDPALQLYTVLHELRCYKKYDDNNHDTDDDGDIQVENSTRATSTATSTSTAAKVNAIDGYSGNDINLLTDPKRSFIVVANKADLVPKSILESKLRKLKLRFPNFEFLPVSATEKQGTEVLLQKLRQRIFPNNLHEYLH